MQLIIDLPNREDALAAHRQRWDEVMADPRWHDCLERIETNAIGQIIMTPPPAFIHGRRQFKIATLIEGFMGGYAATEVGIVTSDGVKVADTVWLSRERFDAVGDQSVLETAPDICIEILSPSNTVNEIQNKFRLYFEAGANECWQCDQQGQMTYYLGNDMGTTSTQSNLCPDFPSEISD